MYFKHEEFLTPNRDVVIWHYYSLSKFLCLLNDKKLYFTRSDQFYDIKEGKFSELDKRLFDSFASGISSRIENGIGCFFVNCWVMNQEELYLMWNTYSSLEEGIAIKTTLGDLIDSLNPDDQRAIIISDVKYIDYCNEYTFDKAGGNANLLAPLFCKRKYFSQEKELRLVYHDHALSSSNDVRGVLFDVNIGKLIKEIWIAPNAGKWFYELIAKEIKLHGLNKLLSISNICSK